MWMTDYIHEIKRQFRDVYGFAPSKVEEIDDPIFDEGQIPDGVYPMEIEGKTDYVKIVDGSINCCNYSSEQD